MPSCAHAAEAGSLSLPHIALPLSCFFPLPWDTFSGQVYPRPIPHCLTPTPALSLFWFLHD